MNMRQRKARFNRNHVVLTFRFPPELAFLSAMEPGARNAYVNKALRTWMDRKHGAHSQRVKA